MTTYEMTIIDFLSQKENFPFVLEIADKIGQVKDKLQRDFWERLKERLEKKLIESKFKDHWILEMNKNILENGGVFWFSPLNKSDLCLYLIPCIEKWGDDFYYGVSWNKGDKKSVTIPLIAEFEKKLRSKEGYKGNDWWLGYFLTDIRIKSNDFFIKTSENPDILADDMAETFWNFFEENSDDIEKCNQAIADAIKKGLPYP